MKLTVKKTDRDRGKTESVQMEDEQYYAIKTLNNLCCLFHTLRMGEGCMHSFHHVEDVCLDVLKEAGWNKYDIRDFDYESEEA